MHGQFNCYTVMFISSFSHVRLSLNNKRLLTYLLTYLHLKVMMMMLMMMMMMMIMCFIAIVYILLQALAQQKITHKV